MVLFCTPFRQAVGKRVYWLLLDGQWFCGDLFRLQLPTHDRSRGQGTGRGKGWFGGGPAETHAIGTHDLLLICGGGVAQGMAQIAAEVTGQTIDLAAQAATILAGAVQAVCGGVDGIQGAGQVGTGRLQGGAIHGAGIAIDHSPSVARQQTVGHLQPGGSALKSWGVPGTQVIVGQHSRRHPLPTHPPVYAVPGVAHLGLQGGQSAVAGSQGLLVVGLGLGNPSDGGLELGG